MEPRNPDIDPVFVQHMKNLFATRQPIQAPTSNVIAFPRQSCRPSRADCLETLLHAAMQDMENHGLKSLIAYYTAALNDLSR